MNPKNHFNLYLALTAGMLSGARRATLKMLATFLIAMTAQTAWAESVSYIDASGNPQNADATEITNDSGNNLASGWYVVKGNVTLNHHLNFTGNVNLILADGATLTITGSKVRTVSGSDIYYGLSCESEDGGTKHDLTIYGQLGGTGKISSSGGGDNPTYSYDFFAQNITINGGVVEAKSTSRCIIASGSITINGGQVSAVNGDIMAQGGNGTIKLGWMKGADYIHAMYYKGTIVFAKQFIYWAYHDNGEPIVIATTNTGDDGYLINDYRIMPDVWGVAVGNDGSTAEKACTITNTDGLDLLAQSVNAGNTFSDKYFKLGQGINYDHTTNWDDANSTENNFTPIGVGSDPGKNFKGHFDGCNKTICGIRIYGSNNYQGLFACPQYTAEIKNIKLADTRIVGNSNVGGIVGKFDQYAITNCHIASSVVIVATSYCGGIAGYDGGSNTSIVGCTSAATVGGTNTNYVGGIAGGIVGSITDCFVTGATVSGTSKVGAIVGFKNTDGTLKNNYYTNSTVNGSAATNAGCNGADVAGARKGYTVTLGTNVSMVGDAAAHGKVNNVDDISITSYANNSGIMYTINGVSPTSTTYAGVTETIKLSYGGVVADGSVVGYSVNDGEATAGNTITMPAENATITEVDFDVWGVTGETAADGSAEKPYVITTTAGLDLLAQKVNAGTDYEGKYFKLGADIEYNKNTANNFTPISYVIVDEYNQAIERPFRGHFDGNGKTISGINLNNSVVDDHGIFGYLYGTVKNLVVNNCSIVADHNIGAIVGVSFGTIENCHVGSDVTLSGHSHVGGIAGWCADATIKGCTSAATIKGIQNSDSNAGHLGGIVGATNGPSSSLTDNLFTGAITGDLGQYIGAIFGWGNEYATLTNNVYTSAGFGGIGAKGSATGADGAGARKAVVISAAEGVTITPTGTKTTYTVSGITTYADNNVLGYDSKLYAGATDAVKLSIVNTGTPETGYEFSGFTAGEGVTITSSENVYTLTVPASDVTVDVVYQAIIYNITYKGVEDEGVTFTEDNPEAYTVADESFALNNPSREGYLFTGWTFEGQTTPTETVTIAKGSTGDKTFTANWKKLLTNEDITVGTIADQTYTGSEIKPAVTVKDGTTDITDQCDFTYNSNKVVGTAEVVISAKESSATYAGEKTVTFKIAPKTVSTPTITLSGTSFEYTGEAIKPTVTVKDGETTIPAEEYTVGYSNNIEAGTATVTITDNEGGNYTVSGSTTFEITAQEPTSIVVTAKNKYWTFSCDQDVKVPEGVKVYTCQLNSNGTKAIITELSATELGGVIKANNGVLLSSDPGDYTFVFSPETTSTAKTYENNELVAVVKPTHFSPNDYYVLKDNEFHVILDDETEVPANKAVLKKPTGASGSRTIGIDEGDDATRIWGVSVADEDAVWYTVSGQRIDKPTKKGLYIKNGVKVVVK